MLPSGIYNQSNWMWMWGPRRVVYGPQNNLGQRQQPFPIGTWYPNPPPVYNPHLVMKREYDDHEYRYHEYLREMGSRSWDISFAEWLETTLEAERNGLCDDEAVISPKSSNMPSPERDFDESFFRSSSDGSNSEGSGSEGSERSSPTTSPEGESSGGSSDSSGNNRGSGHPHREICPDCGEEISGDSSRVQHHCTEQAASW